MPDFEVDEFPASLREQLMQVQVDQELKVEESDFFTPGDSDVATLTGGKMRQTTKHPSGAGYMTIYLVATGEPRKVLQYMAPKFLMKKNNGLPVFSLKPTKEYQLGNVLCLLHPHHPDRELFRRMGLDETRDCGYGSDRPPAGHLASEFDREQHMIHRHSREWAVILSHRAEMEREEERRMRQEEIAAMREMAAAAMGPRPVGRPRKEAD